MAALHLSTVKPNAALFKTRQPPAPKARDFGEPLEPCVQAEGAEGAVVAVQPHQWNQLLHVSFILVFFFYPPGAANAVISPGKAPGTEASPSTWIHGGEAEAARSQPLLMLCCRLVTAGTAVQGDEEESRLWGAASLLFYLRMGKGRTDFRNDCTGGS